MTGTVLIHNRPLIARLLLLFWASEVAVGLLLGAAGATVLRETGNGAAVTLMLLGVVLTLAGIVMSGICWRAALLNGPAIALSAAGLRDLRLSPTLLPWEALRWALVFNGRSHAVQMDLSPEARAMAHIHWPQRALGLLHRLFRQPEFSVLTLGTGLSAHEIAAEIERFKPQSWTGSA